MTPSVGVQLIGKFNVEGKTEVEHLKSLAAEMIDVIEKAYNDSVPKGDVQMVGKDFDLRREVLHQAKMQILSAQMMAVKSLFV